jgi:hypothetical protein
MQNEQKTNWVLYNDTDNNGGSCGEVTATDYDDIIEQVDIEAHKVNLEKLGTDTSKGFSAQNDADYSQIVRWYPDGVRTVMVGGFEHPYAPEDVA